MGKSMIGQTQKNIMAGSKVSIMKGSNLNKSQLRTNKNINVPK